jgi:tetratricopeptide (TPR) repeat protein
MKLRSSLLAAAGALVVLAGCAQVGPGGSASCRSIYVFVPGGSGAVRPVSTCGGVPRDSLAAPAALASLDAGVSPAARATHLAIEGAQAYAGPQEMLGAADMQAFMSRVRSDYAAEKNVGAWGFVVIDALAAGDPAFARTVLTAFEAKEQPQFLGAAQLSPWVSAFEGNGAQAAEQMQGLTRVLPGLVLAGHRALLAEGLGDTASAAAIYIEATRNMERPDPALAGTPAYLARAIMFNSQRLLVLRYAEMLRAQKRNPEAVQLLENLTAASPDDNYVSTRLEKAKANEDVRPLRTLKQAMAQAIADEADQVEERQSIMGAMQRGVDPPFNPLMSSLRQSALLLDPDNGDIRLQEVGELYQHGHFSGALKLAQLGNPPSQARAALASTAALAALELNANDAAAALINKTLEFDSTPIAKLTAANALVNADSTDRAIELIDQALKSNLTPPQRVGALLAKGQARFQAGDPQAAVEVAREAAKLDDGDGPKQFLASMLVQTPARQEGLDIMRGMLRENPDDTGQMNNLGYALVNQPQSPDELDEGFKLLKQAIRLTPNEPNLLDSVGWAYYQYGDFPEARKYIELALEGYKPFKNWELDAHLGDILWRLGEQDKAKEHWRTAIAARPPGHLRADLEKKAASGLETPPPVRRDTPDVPTGRDRKGSSEI